ncbi:MAG TPA: SDR family oxidoreductase [Puia sp.]|nr:SDR family oxidoreductase [Puia sp.]
MDKLLENRSAVVTGGASGIGKATVELFVSEGASVAISDVDESAGKALAHKLQAAGGHAVFIKADVGRAEDCRHLIDSVLEVYGRLDIAFNNAGIGGEMNLTGDMSVEGWNHIISVNLSSVFYCMKYELAPMLRQGKGAIVNMSSILGAVGFANSAGYVAAKHGILGLSQSAALEYSAHGIRINTIGPAFINTPLLTKAGIDETVRKELVRAHPIGRLGEAKEVAELVLWLSSDKASFVTGSYYPIDGGYLAQ